MSALEIGSGIGGEGSVGRRSKFEWSELAWAGSERPPQKNLKAVARRRYKVRVEEKRDHQMGVGSADIIAFPGLQGPPKIEGRSALGAQSRASGRGEVGSLGGFSQLVKSRDLKVRQIGVRVSKALAYALATVALFAFALTAGLSLRPASYQGTTWQHSVAQGESVWGIAAALGSERALEDVVSDIYSLNSLEGETLQPGQELILPTQ